jgi:hypothetical protein
MILASADTPESMPAVIQRLTTARHVFRRIDTVRQEATSRSGSIMRSFGSLAPPNMPDEQELIPAEHRDQTYRRFRFPGRI